MVRKAAVRPLLRRTAKLLGREASMWPVVERGQSQATPPELNPKRPDPGRGRRTTAHAGLQVSNGVGLWHALPGCGHIGKEIRWCRSQSLAQPPATYCHPSRDET